MGRSHRRRSHYRHGNASIYMLRYDTSGVLRYRFSYLCGPNYLGILQMELYLDEKTRGQNSKFGKN